MIINRDTRSSLFLVLSMKRLSRGNYGTLVALVIANEGCCTSRSTFPRLRTDIWRWINTKCETTSTASDACGAQSQKAIVNLLWGQTYAQHLCRSLVESISMPSRKQVVSTEHQLIALEATNEDQLIPASALNEQPNDFKWPRKELSGAHRKRFNGGGVERGHGRFKCTGNTQVM